MTPHSPTAPSPTTATFFLWLDFRGDSSVMAGAHNIRQREERCHERVVLANRQNEKCSVCLRDTHGFSLCPGDLGCAEETAVDA